MTDHPFPRDVIAAVAEEYDTSTDDVDDTLAAVQDAIERGDGKYEYSTQHTFGWSDEDAFFLYSEGIWRTLGDQLSVADDRLEPAREVHRQYMLDSAERRDDADTVEAEFENGASALVVTNTADGDPLFGQDV